MPSIALTGGTIADEIYRAVAALDPSGHVDWMQVDFWWGDERYVPADSTDRNDRAVELDLLDVVGGRPGAGACDAGRRRGAPRRGARRCGVRQQLVRTHGSRALRPGPPRPGAGRSRRLAVPGLPQLDVDDEIAVAVTGSPKPPPERITLTFTALNRTREVWFLVSGEGKAEAVARALADDGSVHETPARGITAENRTWWLDQPAASAALSLRPGAAAAACGRGRCSEAVHVGCGEGHSRARRAGP